jgi:hypothetical protein
MVGRMPGRKSLLQQADARLEEPAAKTDQR